MSYHTSPQGFASPGLGAWMVQPLTRRMTRLSETTPPAQPEIAPAPGGGDAVPAEAPVPTSPSPEPPPPETPARQDPTPTPVTPNAGKDMPENQYGLAKPIPKPRD